MVGLKSTTFLVLIAAFLLLTEARYREPKQKTSSNKGQRRANTGNKVSDAAFSKLATDLWNADSNAAYINTDYRLDLNKNSRLFSSFDSKLLQRPTYKHFISLLDNYIQQTGKAEVVTQNEINEMKNFLAAILKTDVMKKTFKFLHENRYISNDYNQFGNLLKQLWFTLYSRQKGVKDSSGFEHVFVGEIKNGEVGGLHNWLQFYLQEKAGKVTYQGYKINRYPNLLKIYFKDKNASKQKTASMFHGTSPEFEIALYTTCFLVRGEKACEFKIDGGFVRIVTHNISYLPKPVIGTSYPAI